MRPCSTLGVAAMDLEQHIDEIRAGIKAGAFANEASVSQGIVLRLLQALSWPTYDTQVVCPEFSLGGGRVDFALCREAGRPAVFVEVKQLGQGEGAERQLFEYAFHKGVPLAVLTDGQEWNFFLPLEQGEYGDRKFFRLDLFERATSECAYRLTRYLEYDRVRNGTAVTDATKDHHDRARARQIQAVIPKAWEQLLGEGDDLLLELVADRVESICGFRPDPDTVAAFVKAQVGQTQNQPSPAPPESPPRPPGAGRERKGIYGFAIGGKDMRARNAKEVFIGVFKALGERDASFFERFAALPKHGRKRRYLARAPEQLFPGRSDLARDCAVQVGLGWWLGTNVSRATIGQRLEMACAVAGLTFGKDLRVDLGG